MSVGKDSLKRAASATAQKEGKDAASKDVASKTATAKATAKKVTATKADSKKVSTKKEETKEVTAVVNSKTSEEVKEMFAPKERVSHVSEELPVYLL